MTHPDYTDVQPAPDAPLHASTGFVVPKEDIADYTTPEPQDYVVDDEDASEDDSKDDADKDADAKAKADADAKAKADAANSQNNSN